jgi:hypothetical protein
MGNGGCNCDVRNLSNVVEEKMSKYKKQINTSDASKLILHENIISSSSTTSSKYNNKDNFSLLNSQGLDLVKFDEDCDENFCKENKIGIHFLKKEMDDMTDKSLTAVSSTYYKEILKLIQRKDFSLDKECNLVLLEKFKLLKSQKIKNIFYFNFNNCLRILLYNIFLPHISLNLNFDDEKINHEPNQIDLDIMRTFPNNKIFSHKIFSSKLRRLLVSISKDDPDCGYVQGMNFLASYYLMLAGNNYSLTYMILRRVFSLESRIFNLKFRENLVSGFPLLYLYLTKFRNLVKKRHNELDQILQKYEVSDFLWVSKWIQTLFTHKFSFEIVSKFHDILVINGLDYLLLIILAIVDYIQPKVVKISSLEEFLNICEDLYKIKGERFTSFFIFILNKVKSEEFTLLLERDF